MARSWPLKGVHPRVLQQYDLINDKSLIDKDFRITFVEDGGNDDPICRVERLKPL